MNKKQVIRLNEGQLRQIVKESVRNTLSELSNKRMVELFLKKNNILDPPIEWVNDHEFCGASNCHGYIYDSEEDAYNSIVNGENKRYAIDFVESAQSDDEWVDYLIRGGVNARKAKALVKNGLWDKIVKIIVDADGPRWFLSEYSGKVYTLPNGKLLYY